MTALGDRGCIRGSSRFGGRNIGFEVGAPHSQSPVAKASRAGTGTLATL